MVRTCFELFIGEKLLFVMNVLLLESIAQQYVSQLCLAIPARRRSRSWVIERPFVRGDWPLNHCTVPAPTGEFFQGVTASIEQSDALFGARRDRPSHKQYLGRTPCQTLLPLVTQPVI